jgi:dipeptidyl aminopeptidase/acylaminoacyl peptidase
MALATTDAFNAGSCHYGISDLALLDQHTHKFESGYQRRLIGGADAADYAQRLADRSPLNLVDRITAPVIFFQGLDDKVVPPEQTRLMLTSLQARGIAATAHEFPGEGHGFRKAETIEAVLEAELAFFRQVLGLERA